MRFKTDENLPEELAEILRAAGWDALSVIEQQLGGKIDPQIAAICRNESRVLVTLDLGFGDIRTYRFRRNDRLASCESRQVQRASRCESFGHGAA